MLAIEKAPKTWDQILYQDHVIKVLVGAIKKKSPPNSVLIVGKSGVGKSSTSNVYAASLVCTDLQDGYIPCGKCSSCLDIFEDKFNRSVQRVNGRIDNGIDFYRDKLRSLQEYKSFFNDRKVLIIEEVHGLSQDSLDALLVPSESKRNSDVFFIFSTTEGTKVKETLESRCLKFNVAIPNVLEIAKYLVSVVQEKKLRASNDFLTEGLFEVACAAEGNIRKSLHILEKVILSGDLSIEGIKSQIEFETEEDITKVLKDLIDKKYKLAIMNIEKIFQTDEPYIIFSKIFRQVLDLYKIAKGYNLNRPMYERFLKANFPPPNLKSLEDLSDKFMSIKRDCGTLFDKNVFIYNFVKEGN